MNPSDLLDLVKQALGLTSDYQAIKKLGFNQVTVSNWRRNTAFPKNAVLIQFGEILEINAGVLMLYGLEWREKDIKAKAQISKLINMIANAQFDESFINDSTINMEIVSNGKLNKSI
jgi:hypothetical protein